jgi:hypothetical protein
MIKYLLLFLLPLSLFASQILSYNVYNRTDRVDLMLTFDTPYTGLIKESRGKSRITIKLENASIESIKRKKVSSKFLQSIIITPLKNQTQIIAKVPQSVKLIASKTADGYGLRLRFITKKAVATKTSTNSANKSEDYSLSNLPTKKGDDLTQSYVVVIIIMLLGIFILFYIKKRVTPQKDKKEPLKQQKSPWLFNSNETTQEEQKSSSNEVAIRFQKAINENNSVVMLDFGSDSYLVLMGNSNILLDKFHENKPASQQEFESILQSRHEELENFLNKGNNHTVIKEPKKEPLQAYKEKAASILYSDEL